MFKIQIFNSSVTNNFVLDFEFACPVTNEVSLRGLEFRV